MSFIWSKEEAEDLTATLFKPITSHLTNLHKGRVGVCLRKRQERLKQGVKHLGFILQI